MKYNIKDKQSVWKWRDALFDDALLDKDALTFDDVVEIDAYVKEVKNPSLLAFQRHHAETVIDSIDGMGLAHHLTFLRDAMVKRIKICEDQGDLSLSRKRTKAAERNGGIHRAPDEFTEDQMRADPVIRFFHYKHLPEGLQDISREYFRLAQFTLFLPRNAERTKALNKLLEAKDCAVRASLPG